MAESFLILGGGGHAAVCIDLLRATSRTIVGICDPALAPGTAGPLGVEVLGDDGILETMDRQTTHLVNGIGSTRDMGARRRVYEAGIRRGFAFPALCHPSAVLGEGVRVGAGAQVMAGVVLQASCEVGENSIVNTRAGVDHDCRIGRNCHIAPGATLSGGVQVGDDTHLGVGATVVQGVRIGTGCFVAAGAVICKNLSDGVRISPGEICK